MHSQSILMKANKCVPFSVNSRFFFNTKKKEIKVWSETDRIVGFSPLIALNVPVFFSADSFSHPMMLFHIKQATINFTGCADSPNTCRVYSPSWLFQAGKSQFVRAQRNFLPSLMSPLQQPCHKNIAGTSSKNPGTVVSCQTASPAINNHIYSPMHVFFEATCCLWICV